MFEQPFVKSLKFKGAIIQFESEVIQSYIIMNNNTLQDVHIKAHDQLRDEASLFYINGPSVHASNNSFKLLGLLNKVEFDAN